MHKFWWSEFFREITKYVPVSVGSAINLWLSCCWQVLKEIYCIKLLLLLMLLLHTVTTIKNTYLLLYQYRPTFCYSPVSEFRLLWHKQAVAFESLLLYVSNMSSPFLSHRLLPPRTKPIHNSDAWSGSCVMWLDTPVAGRSVVATLNCSLWIEINKI
jgi:hypothetical protein